MNEKHTIMCNIPNGLFSEIIAKAGWTYRMFNELPLQMIAVHEVSGQIKLIDLSSRINWNVGKDEKGIQNVKVQCEVELFKEITGAKLHFLASAEDSK